MSVLPISHPPCLLSSGQTLIFKMAQWLYLSKNTTHLEPCRLESYRLASFTYLYVLMCLVIAWEFFFFFHQILLCKNIASICINYLSWVFILTSKGFEHSAFNCKYDFICLQENLITFSFQHFKIFSKMSILNYVMYHIEEYCLIVN